MMKDRSIYDDSNTLVTIYKYRFGDIEIKYDNIDIKIKHRNFNV